MNKLPQIEISFLLTGQEDFLQEITDALLIKPSCIRRKQDYKYQEFANFMWELTTGKQESKSVDYQSADLLDKLSGKEKIIVQLLNSYKLKADLLVIIHAEIGDGPEINLSTDIIKFAAEIQAEIGFDIYFY